MKPLEYIAPEFMVVRMPGRECTGHTFATREGAFAFADHALNSGVETHLAVYEACGEVKVRTSVTIDRIFVDYSGTVAPTPTVAPEPDIIRGAPAPIPTDVASLDDAPAEVVF
jgi:hypothetical protein